MTLWYNQPTRMYTVFSILVAKLLHFITFQFSPNIQFSLTCVFLQAAAFLLSDADVCHCNTLSEKHPLRIHELIDTHNWLVSL